MPAPQASSSSNHRTHNAHQNSQQHSGGEKNHANSLISAPYNFVPLADRVHLPAWGAKVSHDLPWKEGYSGEIFCTLTAHTPLLVGGKQTKASKDKPGEVKPFQLPDGGHAIPGSSLKGLLRAVTEIVAFGRMRMVDDKRYSVRDLTPGAREIYGARMSAKQGNAFQPKVKAGWLSYEGAPSNAGGDAAKSGWSINPCDFSRVEHDDLAKQSGDTWWYTVPGESDKTPDKTSRSVSSKLEEKYRRWMEPKQGSRRELRLKFQPGPVTDHLHSKNTLRYSKAENLGTGEQMGELVFTGQPSKRTREAKGKKHMEFVFHGTDRYKPIQIQSRVMADFLAIHAESAPWAFLKKEMPHGKRIPVFYLEDGRGEVESLGIAMMYRLPYAFSTHDMICHSSPAHLQAPGAENGYDLADLLFGAVNPDSQADALRGRVFCNTALAEGKPTATAHDPTILNGPKPTYFPNYITQPTAKPSGWTLGGNTPQYATYIQTSASKAPTLRGFKRYPVRPATDAQVQPLTEEQRGNKSVQITLHTLPAGTTFESSIVFHNLRPEELGALLWVLTWGGNAGLRHAIGMGKPFGFGQIGFALDTEKSRCIPNDPAQPAQPLSDALAGKFMSAFEEHMQAAIPGWRDTPQLLNLYSMADPSAAAKLTSGMELRHMRLESKAHINEFQSAKQAGRVLADYAVASGALQAAQYKSQLGKPCERATSALPASAAPVAKQAEAPIPTCQEIWERASLLWENGSSKLTVRSADGKKTAAQSQAKALLETLPEAARNRLKNKGELKGVHVTVEVKANLTLIVSLHMPPA